MPFACTEHSNQPTRARYDAKCQHENIERVLLQLDAVFMRRNTRQLEYKT